jgi:hypothetical protein
MKALAIKQGHSREKALHFQEMGTFKCDLCGDVFCILHHPVFADKWTAEKQAYWLEKVLAEEHEREKAHPEVIELPD